MQGYEITSLSKKTQELVKNEGIDSNRDGLINEDNGELANLLSRTGKDNINDLCYDSWFDAKQEDFVVGGIMALAGTHLVTSAYRMRPRVTLTEVKTRANELFEKYNGTKPKPVSLNVSRDIAGINQDAIKQLEELDKQIGSNLVEETKKRQVKLQAKFDQNRLKEIERRKAWNQRCAEWKPKVSMKECLKKALKKSRLLTLLQKAPISGVSGALGILGLGVAAYLFTSEPSKGIAQWTGRNDYTPVERARSAYEDQYRQVFGKEAELIEYTPQKGEYWISILKAKYGVDNATAQRMAHRIKDVIYNDSTAAKQSPVMYLPRTWEFEGKTYNYNEKAQADKTDKYSDDVKTEMGKMDKDIKYDKK